MKLIIEDDEGHKTTVPFVREEITVGRQDGNTIRLTERNVSRKHARFFRKSGGVFVEDLSSHNGIKVNGDRIEAAIALKEGDLVQIGDYDLAVQEEQDAVGLNRATVKMDALEMGAGDGPTDSGGSTSRDLARAARAPSSAPAESSDGGDADEIERDPSKPAAPARGAQATAVIRMNGAAESPRAVAPSPSKAPPAEDIAPQEAPRLVMVSTELAGREFACLRTVLTIGRGEECDIPIEHRSLSREHARLERQADGQWRVIDLGSSNRLQVNGEEYADSIIANGDVITLGHVKLRFVAPGEEFTYVPEGSGSKRSPAVLVAAGLGAVVVIGVGVYFGVLKKPAVETVVPDNPKAQAPPPLIPAKEKAPEAAAKTGEPEHGAATPEPTPGAKSPEATPESAAAKTPTKAAEPQKAAPPSDEVAVPDAVEPPKPAPKEEKAEPAAVAHEERHPAKPVKEAHGKPEPHGKPEKQAAPAPDAAPSPKDQATQLRTEAEDLMRDGKNEPAIAKLRQALKLNPNDPAIHKVLGGCLANDGEMDEAAKEYKKFIDLAPNSPDVPRVKQMLDAYIKSKAQ